MPHFEKMPYDQALLASACTGAWQATKRPAFRATAEQILEYVLRELTSPEGGFYSAEDADSEGEEGRFYLWTTAELEAVLGPEDAKLAARIFGVVDERNFRDESTGERTGRNILHPAQPLPEIAARLDMDEDGLTERLESVRERLFAARERRVRPLRDDKILTDWNGLMIAAMADAGRTFRSPQYVVAARHAADFALAELRAADGWLWKRWRRGEAAMPGVLDDHAFLVHGLLAPYEACHEVRYLVAARELTDRMVEDYHDAARGCLFLSGPGREDLIVRAKVFYDGAPPAGNSVAALDLLVLARLTGEVRYEELAAKTLAAAARSVRRTPMGTAGC